jgi:hypothetical protein
MAKIDIDIEIRGIKIQWYKLVTALALLGGGIRELLVPLLV